LGDGSGSAGGKTLLELMLETDANECDRGDTGESGVLECTGDVDEPGDGAVFAAELVGS
jgi:hypothetical protein